MSISAILDRAKALRPLGRPVRIRTWHRRIAEAELEARAREAALRAWKGAAHESYRAREPEPRVPLRTEVLQQFTNKARRLAA